MTKLWKLQHTVKYIPKERQFNIYFSLPNSSELLYKLLLTNNNIKYYKSIYYFISYASPSFLGSSSFSGGFSQGPCGP